MKLISFTLATFLAAHFATGYALEAEDCPRTITLSISDFRAGPDYSASLSAAKKAEYKLFQKRLSELKSFMFTAPLFRFQESKGTCQYYTHVATDLKASIELSSGSNNSNTMIVNFQLGEEATIKYYMRLTTDASSPNGLQIRDINYTQKHVVNFFTTENNFRFAYPIGSAFIQAN